VDSVGRRAKESRKLLLAGVFVNLVLALTKIAGGLFGCSNALIVRGDHFQRMLRASIGAVLDAQAAPEIVTAILGAVRAVPGVTSVEKCRVRKSGFMRFADIHVRVAGESTVREGHDIAHSVRNRLLDGDFHLADLVVHIEPETLQD